MRGQGLITAAVVGGLLVSTFGRVMAEGRPSSDDAGQAPASSEQRMEDPKRPSCETFLGLTQALRPQDGGDAASNLGPMLLSEFQEVKDHPFVREGFDEDTCALFAMIAATLSARAGDIAGASALLDGVLAHADALEEETVYEIGLARARLGDVEGAIKTAALVDYDDDKDQVLQAAATAVARSGNSARALIIAATIKYEGRRAWALQAIAVVRATTGDIAGALRTAESIGEEYGEEIAAAYQGIAEAQAKRGDLPGSSVTFARAIRAVSNGKGREVSVEALARVASAQARVGDKASAGRTFDLAADRARGIVGRCRCPYPLLTLAAAELKAGDLVRTETSLGSIPDNVPSQVPTDLVVSLARGHAKAGDLAAALAAILRYGDQDTKETAFASVAGALEEAGNRIWASRVAAFIKSPDARATAFIEIALAQTHRGDLEGGRATLHHGVDELGPALEDGSINLDTTLRITQTFVDLGDHDASSGMLRGLVDHVLKQRDREGFYVLILTDIGSAQLKTGDPDGAMKTASLIEDADDRASFHQGLSYNLAKSGAVTLAMAWASSLQAPLERFGAHLGVAWAIVEPLTQREEMDESW